MKRMMLTAVLASLLVGCATPPLDITSKHLRPSYARIVTDLGTIDVMLNHAAAPISATNFERYARRGFYDGTVFHRTVPGFVVQGGGYLPDLTEKKGDVPPITNEWRSGLKNKRGPIAWARDEDPDTAANEFYFNLVDNEKLDRSRPNTGQAGYAAFGVVVSGMDVIDAIASGAFKEIPERDMKNVPLAPVMVRKVELFDSPPHPSVER